MFNILKNFFSLCSSVLLAILLLQQNVAYSELADVSAYPQFQSINKSVGSDVKNLIIIDAGIQDYPQLFKSLALEQGVRASALPSSVHPGRIYHLANQDWLVLLSTAQSIDDADELETTTLTSPVFSNVAAYESSRSRG